MKKDKVLIITQPLRVNYGGILQAYALQKVVAELGFEVWTDNTFYLKPLSLKHRVKDFLARLLYGCFLNRENYKPLIKKRPKRKDYEKVAKNILPFISQNIKTIDFFESRVFPKASNIEKFDIFISGSDQVWRRKYGVVTRYFFDFLRNTNKKRFSYSASFGTDNLNEYSQKEKRECKELIKSFSSISVREDSAIEIILKEFEQRAVLTLDPTFLLSKEDYLSLINNSYSKADNTLTENLFVYILDESKEKEELKEVLSRRLALKTLDIMPKKDWKTLTSKEIDENAVFPSVEEWLKGLVNAKFVLTDSFHAVVFSIIFNKPFLCIGNKERGLTRFTSLLTLFDLDSRLIYNKKDLTGILLHNIYRIDYEKINIRKEELKQKSLDYLNKNLSL
ncbi:MAG: polysaccharide pyruvyl transferase family protein [Bacteroidota bacterium]|nr:polysaccharide pyruvyl transferase family protein [Bacteroidota bacterium]